MDNIESMINLIDVEVKRDLDRELTWAYSDYENIVEEALSFHCATFIVSDLLKLQMSRLYHQGYVLIEDIAVAVPITSVLSTLERVADIGKGRGRLRNISKRLGFEVLHTHFGQSSFVIKNWVNYARATKLKDKGLDIKEVYQSLIGSVSKQNNTGEWVVYSKYSDSITLWCLWLHEAGDEALLRELKAQQL